MSLIGKLKERSRVKLREWKDALWPLSQESSSEGELQLDGYGGRESGQEAVEETESDDDGNIDIVMKTLRSDIRSVFGTVDSKSVTKIINKIKLLESEIRGLCKLKMVFMQHACVGDELLQEPKCHIIELVDDIMADLDRCWCCFPKVSKLERERHRNDISSVLELLKTETVRMVDLIIMTKRFASCTCAVKEISLPYQSCKSMLQIQKGANESGDSLDASTTSYWEVPDNKLSDVQASHLGTTPSVSNYKDLSKDTYVFTQYGLQNKSSYQCFFPFYENLSDMKSSKNGQIDPQVFTKMSFMPSVDTVTKFSCLKPPARKCYSVPKLLLDSTNRSPGYFTRPVNNSKIAWLKKDLVCVRQVREESESEETIRFLESSRCPQDQSYAGSKESFVTCAVPSVVVDPSTSDSLAALDPAMLRRCPYRTLAYRTASTAGDTDAGVSCHSFVPSQTLDSHSTSLQEGPPQIGNLSEYGYIADSKFSNLHLEESRSLSSGWTFQDARSATSNQNIQVSTDEGDVFS